MLNRYRIKHHFRNFLVDIASLAIVLAIAYTIIQGFTILYTSWYNTSKIPSPGDFQAAGYQFTGAISLVYMFTLTRKHYRDEAKEMTEKKRTQTQTQSETTTSQSSES
jgi:hypothetical protein